MSKDKLANDVVNYYKAFQAAYEGGQFEMNAEGVSALNKIVGNTGRMVPSVTEIDDSGRGIGYDLFSRLLKDRIVLLQGPVDEAMAAVACASLLFLDSIGDDGRSADGKAERPDITVYIDSPGGSVIAGRAIYDTMRTIKSKITTVGMGMQASMGSILLAAGDKRLMTDGSKLMIHSIGSGTRGKLSEQEIDLEQTRRMFQEMKSIYIAHIGLNAAFWDIICAKDTWLTAEQAKKMGFIHGIIEPQAAKAAPYGKAAKDFMKAIQDAREVKVPKTVEGIKQHLLGTGADNGIGEQIRAECIVALSQLPEFWTEELKAERSASVSANDNDKVTKNDKAGKPEL